MSDIRGRVFGSRICFIGDSKEAGTGVSSKRARVMTRLKEECGRRFELQGGV